MADSFPDTNYRNPFARGQRQPEHKRVCSVHVHLDACPVIQAMRFSLILAGVPHIHISFSLSDFTSVPQPPHRIPNTIRSSSVEFSGNPAHRHRHLLAQFRRHFHFQQISLPAQLQKPPLILVVQKNHLLPIPPGSSHDKPPPVFQPQLPSHRKTLWNQAFMSDPFHGYFGKT